MQNKRIFCRSKNAFIREFRHFKTVLAKLLFSLIYCLVPNIFISGRRYKVMNHLLKGIIVMVGVVVINMIISIVCNQMGVDLNSTVMAAPSAICALFVYDAWIKREKD